MSALPTLLSPDDVAEIVGLTPATVRAACRAGELQASKVRGRLRIHPDAVAEWLDDTRVQPDGTVPARNSHHPTPRPRLRGDDAGDDDMRRAREMRRRRTAARIDR